MHIYSTVKPQPHIADPSDNRDLEALGIEVMVDDRGVIIVLLIRYFTIEPLSVEGDHLCFSLDVLLQETENYYQVPRNKWRLASGFKNRDLSNLIVDIAKDISQAGVDNPIFFKTDDDFFDYEKKSRESSE